MRNLETSLIILAGCLLIVSGQYTEEYEKEVKPLAEQCAQCVGASEENVRTVYKYEELTTMSLACLQYCVYHQLGVMNGTEFASEDYIVQVYKKIHVGNQRRIDNARRNVRECIHKGKLSSNNDPCKIARTAQDCMRTQK